MPAADRLTVLLVGDVMTGRGIDQVLPHPGRPVLHEAHVQDARTYVRLAEAVNGPVGAPLSAARLWGPVRAEIERVAPQARILNLETAVTAGGDPWPAKGIHYRMSPANLDVLQVVRPDVCVLANNHVMDWGRTGLHDTLQALRRAGLATAGAGEDGLQAWAPARVPGIVGGQGPVTGDLLVFGCAAASSGVPPGWAAGPGRAGVALLPDLTPATAQHLADDIRRRRRRVDRVIVSVHWGANWGLTVPLEHRAFARHLIDAGAADIVYGHSSHHPMPLEVYRGRLILYGCGDLVNDYEGITPDPLRTGANLRGDVGALYFASLSTRTGRLLGLEVLPTQMRRLQLNWADGAAADWLHERLVAEAEPGVPGLCWAERPQRGWSLRLPG
jgi:poly-gamma-glutamate capsule biosynthesis protein CapA/YwtB (metallophosphatase superfamily)